MSRGAEPSEAQLHEGASEPAVDTCCLSPVWNTGALKRICGSKSKTPLARVEHGLPLRQHMLPPRAVVKIYVSHSD